MADRAFVLLLPSAGHKPFWILDCILKKATVHGILLSLSLQTFLLDGNCLSDLPSELGSLQRLGYLGLSFNQFNHVPQVLERLSSMEKLCMAGNYLETLTLQNFRLLHVKHIDLRYKPAPKSIFPQRRILKATKRIMFRQKMKIKTVIVMPVCSLTVLFLIIFIYS